jgi:hypothetical protein
MGIWWQLAIGISVLWLVLRLVLSRFSPREPSASLDDPFVDDRFARVPSPEKRGPQNRSGAVALAEPDEGDESRSSPLAIRESDFSVLWRLGGRSNRG